jgi:hypothetical protein
MTHAGITLPLTLVGIRMGIAAVQGWMDGHHSLDEIVNSIGHYFQPTTEHHSVIAGHDTIIQGHEVSVPAHDVPVNHDGYTITSTIDSQDVTGHVTGYTAAGDAIVHVPAVTETNVVPAQHVTGTLNLDGMKLEGSEQFSGQIDLTGDGTADGTLDVHHVTDYHPGTSDTTGTDAYDGTFKFAGKGDMSGVKSDISITVKDGIRTFDMTVPAHTEITTVPAHDEIVSSKNYVPGQEITMTVPKTTMTTIVPATTETGHVPAYKVYVPDQTIREPDQKIDGTETSPWFWEKVTAFTVGLTAGARTLYNRIVDKIYKPKQEEAYKELKKASRKLRGTGLRRRARGENPNLDALMREQNLEARVEEHGAAEGGAEEDMPEMEPIGPEAMVEPRVQQAPDAQAPQAPGPQPPAEEPAEDDGMGQA